MSLREFIAKLQAILAEQGDIPVFTFNGGGDKESFYLEPELDLMWVRNGEAGLKRSTDHPDTTYALVI